MTSKIDRLLEVQNRRVDFSEHGLSSRYMQVLHHAWNGKWASAANTAAEHIAEDHESSDTVFLYRAWIEALAQLEDYASLAELNSHLLHLGQDIPELKQTFMALRGIIHLELDQAPAARLLLRAISGRIHNPYCLEFEQICSRRGLSTSPFAIGNSTENIADFFVWQTLLQDLTNHQMFNDLQMCLKHVDQVFPGSPCVHLFDMHIAADQGNWQQTLVHAQILHKAYPSQRDYGFCAAYAALEAGHIDIALQTLDHLPNILKDADVDVMNLLGRCLVAKFERDQIDDDAHRAISVLSLASRSMKLLGLDVHSTLQLIQKLEEQVGGHSVPHFSADQFRAPRSWMVVLSPRRTSELMTARDEVVETLHRPLGAEAEPGDIVLFASRAAHTLKKGGASRQEWRLLAMYRVISRPFWHATTRWTSTLQLIDRPEQPIPIDAHELKSDINVRGQRKTLPRGHHARFGVYSLDDSAMDIMIAAVKRRSQGIDHDSERRHAALNKKPG